MEENEEIKDENNVKDMKKESKRLKKEEKKRLKEEKKKNKRPIDKMKILSAIIASIVIIIMLFSVCGTLLFYLGQ